MAARYKFESDRVGGRHPDKSPSEVFEEYLMARLKAGWELVAQKDSFDDTLFVWRKPTREQRDQ